MTKRPHYTPENYRAAESVGYLLSLAYATMRPQVEARFEKENISFTQWRVLISLRDRDANTCADLSRSLFHDKGSMTRLLDQLEERSLVSRQRSADDRRVVTLALTPSGRNIANALAPKVIACLNEMLEDFTSEEVRTLTQLLKKLIEALQKHETSRGMDAP